MSAAQALLERLLRKAESASGKAATKPATLKLDGASDYTAGMGTLAELEAFHAEMILAERAGAVRLERERRHGDGQRLTRVTVVDLAALARQLDVLLLEDRVAAAERRLAPWRARFPVLDAVVAVWRASRSVRKHGPEAAGELADAARAVAARQDDAGEERILRRESVRLFDDSKRLEKLTAWLELLVTGELAASGLEDTHVWSAIGLRREPQALLVAGPGTAHLASASVPLVRPYLGLPTTALRTMDTPARWLLTVENLTSFHEAAAAATGMDGLLLYTGGMPSPAWRVAYARILAGLAPNAPIYHWGDIDEGGFRIAAVLAACARETGRHLLPWCMSPAQLPAAIRAMAKPPDTATLKRMQHHADAAGWADVSRALMRHPLRLEQESLPVRLPAVSARDAPATPPPIG